MWVNLLALLLATAIGLGPVKPAPDNPQSEAAQMVAELMGAPVFAAEGVEIGEVAEIALDGEGTMRIRMATHIDLGLGSRTVELPDGAFMVLRGAVVLDLPAEAVRLLPDSSPSR